jgi:hypothetical protein
MKRKLLFVLLSLSSTTVFAQFPPPDGRLPVMTPELLPIWQKHALLVNGADDPAGIPYGYAVERVFWRYADIAGISPQDFRLELRKTIPVTDADADRFAETASESYTVAARVRNESSARTDAICAELVGTPAGTAEAVAFAARFAQVEADEAEQLSAHYREAVARLAPQSRSALDAYVDTNIRRQMTWGHDLVGLANEVPAAFLAHWNRVCENLLLTPPSERAWKHTVSTETVVIPND